MMKNSCLLQRNTRKFQYVLTWLSRISKPWKNNNTQNFRKANLLQQTVENLMIWKSIGLMLLVIYNDVIKSSQSASIC